MPSLSRGQRGLLWAIDNKYVTWYAGSDDSYRDDVRPGRICTKGVTVLERAGLAVKPTRDEGPWTLTDAGRWELEKSR